MCATGYYRADGPKILNQSCNRECFVQFLYVFRDEFSSELKFVITLSGSEMRTFHTYFQIVYYLFFSIHFILQCATPVISKWETSVSCVQPEAAETLMMLLRVSVPATPIWLLVVEVHPLLIPMLLVTVSYLHHHSSVLAFATLKPSYKTLIHAALVCVF